MKKILILIAMLCLLTGCFGNDNKEIKKTETKKEEASNTMVEKKPVKTSIKLSFAGDFTLGNYANQAYSWSNEPEYAWLA